MILFRAGNRHGAGSTPGSYSDTTSPPFGDDPLRELAMGRRIVAVDAATEHCHGAAARLERAAVGLTVDAAGHPAHDDHTCSCELAPEHPRHSATVGRAGSGTDDRSRGRSEQREVGVSPQPEHRRWIVDRSEERRVGRLPPAKAP